MTTSVAESSNASLKKHGICPSDQLHIAGKKINDISSEKFSQTDFSIERITNTVAVKESFFQESNDLVPYGLKLVENEWVSRVNYSSACISADTFYVRYDLPSESEENMVESPIPKFIRLRIVHLKNGIAHCSCGFYCRHRLPCRHILHIVHDMKISYCGIHWTKLYAQ
jgi:hypothetical protein